MREVSENESNTIRLVMPKKDMKRIGHKINSKSLFIYYINTGVTKHVTNLKIVGEKGEKKRGNSTP